MILIALFLSASAGGAEAVESYQGTLTEFLRAYDSGDPKFRETANALLVGTIAGLSAANAMLQVVRHEPPLYCQPGQLALAPEQVADILHREIAENPTVGSSNPAAVAAFALARVFPCPKSN
jgi:hypothetical protein